MRRPFGHRQGRLPSLAATAAHLVPAEVPGDVVDPIERLEQVAGEHHVLHELGQLPVPDHAAVGGREGEVFEQRLATEGAAGVYAEFHVADQILEAAAPVRDVGVGHADDRRVAERNGARVPRGPLAHGGRRLARVQPAHEDAFLDQRGVLRGGAFVVEGERAAQAGGGAIVAHVQARFPEAPAQRHHLAGLRILVDEVGLGEVAEGLVDEHARELGVEDDGVRAAGDHRGVEQLDGALGGLPEPDGLILDGAPAPTQADGLEPLLDRAVAPRHRRAGERHFGSELVQRAAFGVDVPVVADLVAVARERVDDAVTHREQLAVVRLEQAFLLGDGNTAHVAVEIEDRLRPMRRDVGEADRRRDAHGARQLHGAGDHGLEPIQ